MRDGQEVAGRASAPSPWFVVAVAIGAIAVATCPSHDSFEAYLATASQHPAAWLGGVLEKLRISVAAETKSYLILRSGIFRGRRFVGAFHTWWRLPSLPSVSLGLPSLTGGRLSSLVCNADGAAPHEHMAFLFIVGFLLQQLAPPRVMARHAHCSLSALRQGRVWTLLTANLAHANPAHLLHNLLQLLHLGPILHGALGCEKAAGLLLATCLAASAGSVLWHGVLGGRAGAGSVGGSGVAMGLVAANAALFPHVTVVFYGLELQAHLVPLFYLALDVLSAGGRRGDVDVSAHAGGAAAGWFLATRWRPWWL